MAVPGCPEAACCTASVDKARIVSIERRRRSSFTSISVDDIRRCGAASPTWPGMPRSRDDAPRRAGPLALLLPLLQDAALVLDRGVLLRIVLGQLLELLAGHVRDDVAFLIALETVERQGHRALADAEEAADVDERVQLAVGPGPRDTGDLPDVLALGRHDAVTDDLLRIE